MNKKLNTAVKLAALGAVAMLAGCAFVPDTVHPQYIPQANVQKIPGADKVAVDVVVKNENKTGNEISRKKDGFDISMAGIYMHVAKDFKTAIEKGIYDDGFSLSSNGLSTVNVVITNFYLPEQEGLVTQDYKGLANIIIKVYNIHGDILYKKDIKTSKGDTDYVIGGVGRAAKSLMNDEINKVVSDPLFISAIMKCGSSHHGVAVKTIR